MQLTLKPSFRSLLSVGVCNSNIAARDELMVVFSNEVLKIIFHILLFSELPLEMFFPFFHCQHCQTAQLATLPDTETVGSGNFERQLSHTATRQLCHNQTS